MAAGAYERAEPTVAVDRLHGRDEALSRAVAAIRGGGLVVHGPRGMGRTTLLEHACEAVEGQLSIVRCSGAEVAPRPGGGLQHLVCEFPADVLADLPTASRALLLDTGWAGSVPDHVVGAAFARLLWATAARLPSALVVDDIDLFDPESLHVIRPVLRQAVADGVLGALVTSHSLDELTPEPGGRPSGGAAGAGGPMLPRRALEPLAVQDTVGMLGDHGCPTELALWAHRESGGVPGLALALVRCAREDTQGVDAEAVRDVVRDRTRTIPAGLRPTLLAVAAMHRPFVSSLERAGIPSAAARVREAVGRGLLVAEGDEVRLVPSGMAGVLLEDSDPDEVRALHARLAATALSSALRHRHLALAALDPGDGLARAVAHEADEVSDAGQHDLAAELYLLASDRATWQLEPERTEWLTRSIEEGVVGRSGRTLARAVQEVWQSDLDRDRSIRVKVSLLELEDQRPIEIDETLAAAVAEASGDPQLLARVVLQRAKTLLTTSDLASALTHATRAASLAEASGDTDQHVEALVVAGAVQRSLGLPEGRRTMRRALELSGSPRRGTVHMSAAFIDARWRMYDDDLTGARTRLIDLLASVGPDAGQDTIHVLRSLVDVVARQGKGREALDLAARAMRAVVQFSLPATTGWYVEALAELTGGSFERAGTISERGVQLAVEREDERYLRRHLAGLGAAQLALGEPEAADTFRRLVAVDERAGLGDLTALRWHPDGVTSLVVAGATDEARTLLDRSRARADAGSGSPSLTAMLDRAEAALVASLGDVDGARDLAVVSARTLERLGQPVEAARSWVTLGVVERRGRRVAASREAFAAAHALVDPHGPWAAWVAEREHRPVLVLDPPVEEPLDGVGAPEVADVSIPGLSAMEQQVAREVALGRSNREIAQRLHLSVKTVEGTLTRCYRKLGIRSRTQLAAHVLARPR